MFVPLLAFGCYGAARIAYGPRAGLLAAVVALGAPMVVSAMHEYYLDPPRPRWSRSASGRCSPRGASSASASRRSPACVVRARAADQADVRRVPRRDRDGRGGPRGPRAPRRACSRSRSPCALVAGPWYVYHASDLGSSFGQIGNAIVDPDQSPPRFSRASLAWYGWDLVNQQVLPPFTLAFLVGVATALRRLLRRPLRHADVEPELLGGAAVSYLGMTCCCTRIRATRCRRWCSSRCSARAGSRPCHGGGRAWGSRRRSWRSPRSTSSGCRPGSARRCGSRCRVRSSRWSVREQLTLYQSIGWLRGGPARDGDVQALLAGLHADGIRAVVAETNGEPMDFNPSGIRR